jgi:hypothetical protein
MHHNIELVKGMLLKGQAFLSSNLKRQAISALDEASNEFTAMKLEIESYKGTIATMTGSLSVLEQERTSLVTERDNLRAMVESKPMSDNAALVPFAVVQTDTGETVVVSTVEPT